MKKIEHVDDRREHRYEVEGEVVLKVLFTRSDDVLEVRGRLRNVGSGGLYVETDQEVPPGALADLDLRLEGRPLANTLGLIRWIKPGKGAGVEFFYATEEERVALESYLSDWLKTRRKKS